MKRFLNHLKKLQLRALLEKSEGIVDDFEIHLSEVLEQCRLFKEKYEETRGEWEDLSEYDTAEKFYRFLLYSRYMMMPTVMLSLKVNKLANRMLDLQECLFPLIQDFKRDLGVDDDENRDMDRYVKEVRRVLNSLKNRKI
jgi:hypothetical protein